MKPSKVSAIDFTKPTLKKRHQVYESVPVPRKKPSVGPKLSDDVKRNLLKIIKVVIFLHFIGMSQETFVEDKNIY